MSKLETSLCPVQRDRILAVNGTRTHPTAGLWTVEHWMGPLVWPSLWDADIGAEGLSRSKAKRQQGLQFGHMGSSRVARRWQARRQPAVKVKPGRCSTSGDTFPPPWPPFLKCREDLEPNLYLELRFMHLEKNLALTRARQETNIWMMVVSFWNHQVHSKLWLVY